MKKLFTLSAGIRGFVVTHAEAQAINPPDFFAQYDPQKQVAAQLQRAPVQPPKEFVDIAFSTLDEALEYIREYVAGPRQETDCASSGNQAALRAVYPNDEWERMNRRQRATDVALGCLHGTGATGNQVVNLAREVLAFVEEGLDKPEPTDKPDA